MSDSTEQHIDHVRALTRRNAPLDTRAPTASISNPDWFGPGGEPRAARRRMHRQYITERVAGIQPDQRRHAVMLAGPPGAGKSHLRGHELAGAIEGHLLIDPDEIKGWLLRVAERDESLDAFLKPPAVRELERAGEKFFPMELSALVHMEAVQVADAMRGEAVRRGLPMVLDGVLSDADRALADARQLESAGYSLEVVCLDVAPAVSEHQIRQRWREAYEATLAGHGDLMGGRWVPSSFAQYVLNGPGGRSLPAISAERLAHEVEAVDRYRVFTRSSVDAPTVLAIDQTRVRPGAPMIETEAARAYRTAHGRAAPYRRRGAQEDRDVGR